MATQKNILVYADWHSLSEATLLGTLHSSLVRGEEIFSFEYDSSWLKQHDAQVLDPDLYFYEGPQYIPQDDKKKNFGLFLDSCPDRWGKTIMKRREALLAKEEERSERRLTESDYLLGVYDNYRLGALRFKVEGNDAFLDNNPLLAAPPLSSLRELEHASLMIGQVDAENDPEYKKWLYMLISPGASLGGARPKASIVDKNKQLWIAKFPSREDSRDMGAWEMVVNQLAHNAGINCATAQIKRFQSEHHTFLSKRFDRTKNGERIHFASAMTLLGRNDGDGHEEDIGYLDIASIIIRLGAKPDEDLEQLWQRIVFNIAVSNTDDHLRNHGFLLTEDGWRLAPAYDVNPEPHSHGLALNITETSNALDLDAARQVAEYFRLSSQKAEEIISEVLNAVSQWKKTAIKYKISKREIESLNRAFLHT